MPNIKLPQPVRLSGDRLRDIAAGAHEEMQHLHPKAGIRTAQTYWELLFPQGFVITIELSRRPRANLRLLVTHRMEDLTFQRDGQEEPEAAPIEQIEADPNVPDPILERYVFNSGQLENYNDGPLQNFLLKQLEQAYEIGLAATSVNTDRPST